VPWLGILILAAMAAALVHRAILAVEHRDY
jgi:hypothetical protein